MGRPGTRPGEKRRAAYLEKRVDKRRHHRTLGEEKEQPQQKEKSDERNKPPLIGVSDKRQELFKKLEGAAHAMRSFFERKSSDELGRP